MTIKVKGLRWWMIGLLTLGTITNYLARSSLSIAAPAVMQHLHISTHEYGWITGAFLAMYPIGAPLTGYLVDRIGLRAGFLICGVAWSLVCMAHGFVAGWVGLFVLRGVLGLVEAAFIPGGMRAAACWFPAQERGIAAGVFNLGTSTGAILAPPLIAWSILHYSWQVAFMIAGALGLCAGPGCGLFSTVIRTGTRRCRARRLRTSPPGGRARCGRTRAKSRRCARFSKSAISGASRFRVVSRTRCGARGSTGCRYISIRRYGAVDGGQARQGAGGRAAGAGSGGPELVRRRPIPISPCFVERLVIISVT